MYLKGGNPTSLPPEYFGYQFAGTMDNQFDEIIGIIGQYVMDNNVKVTLDDLSGLGDGENNIHPEDIKGLLEEHYITDLIETSEMTLKDLGLRKNSKHFKNIMLTIKNQFE